MAGRLYKAGTHSTREESPHRQAGQHQAWSSAEAGWPEISPHFLELSTVYSAWDVFVRTCLVLFQLGMHGRQMEAPKIKTRFAQYNGMNYRVRVGFAHLTCLCSPRLCLRDHHPPLLPLTTDCCPLPSRGLANYHH